MTALLFDMDGLLLDTERVAMEAYFEACKGLGFVPSEELFLNMVGTSAEKSREMAAKYHGPSLDMDAFDALWHHEIKTRLASHVPLRPGVAEVIPALAAKGVPMVVVTSTRTEPAQRALETAGLLHNFADVVGANAVKNRKPHPEPYLTGAARVGVAPGQCYAFEDSDTGTRAALAAGCVTSQIPDLRPPGVPIPELGQKVYSSLPSALIATGWI